LSEIKTLSRFPISLLPDSKQVDKIIKQSKHGQPNNVEFYYSFSKRNHAKLKQKLLPDNIEMSWKFIQLNIFSLPFFFLFLRNLLLTDRRWKWWGKKMKENIYLRSHWRLLLLIFYCEIFYNIYLHKNVIMFG